MASKFFRATSLFFLLSHCFSLNVYMFAFLSVNAFFSFYLFSFHNSFIFFIPLFFFFPFISHSSFRRLKFTHPVCRCLLSPFLRLLFPVSCFCVGLPTYLSPFCPSLLRFSNHIFYPFFVSCSTLCRCSFPSTP